MQPTTNPLSADSRNYILIAGLPRSGSTLVQAILNQSDVTFTMPEMHFFESARKITDSLHMTRDQVSELLMTLQEKWQVVTKLPAGTLFCCKKKAAIDICELYFKLIEQYRPANGKSWIGVEKTPGNIFAMDELLNRQSGFKVILTSRNPVDFASSMIKQYWSPDSILKISRLWNQTMLKIDALKNKYPTRVMVLDYREMVTRPELAFEHVFSFSGLVWQKKFLSHINSSSGEYIQPHEAPWKAENIRLPAIEKSKKKCTLTVKQRLLLHRECMLTALSVGYIRHYKF